MLVFGGRSGEHGISCATAASVYQAIDPQRFEVIPVGITKTGQWVPLDFEHYDFRIRSDSLAEVPADLPNRVALVPGVGLGEVRVGETLGVDRQTLSLLEQVDVALPLLHGPFGEDGTIQGLFEMMNLPYVGCGVLASAACMEKNTTKTLLQAAGIPAGAWVTVAKAAWKRRSRELRAQIQQLQLPLFVKPSRAGSSLGVTKVESYQELDAAIAAAWQHDPLVIVEQGLTGLEVECAVLSGRGEGSPRATVPGQIAMAPEVDFYDYQTKYFSQGSVGLNIPAPISAELSTKVQRLAIWAFEVMGCEGLARIDFFVDPATEQVTVNEINTMPGFTPFSMYPKLWEASGISYQQLLTELLELALERGTGLH